MQYIVGLDNYYNQKRTAVTLGKFDGLHRGHEKLIEKVIECAEKENVESVVCSFDMSAFFKELNVERKVIMTQEEKKLRLDGRVDYLVKCPFTSEFSRISAEDFVEKILVGLFHASYVVVGTDFCFGYQKSGNVEVLRKLQQKYGYKLIVLEKERYQGRVISSTYVKEVLAEGKIRLVNELLGYPYTIMGTVEHGKRLGRTLGFPTMNVAPDSNKMMPPKGVYMMRVCVAGKWYPSIGNIGTKPTVTDENRLLIESFLLQYNGDAYGKAVKIELLEFRRPERKFKTVQEMKACVDKDIAYGKEFFASFCE
ncbi:MAG: bifunctional riboflavin kinase/FAD synthetase [Eubacteriales bacterium]|nr:bifunctional riboflavin kinase/FAD synthetase [Eubacteriales bacterium]